MAQPDAVRIGIIGTGFARTTQLPGFRACGDSVRLVAIASGRRARAEQVAREFGIPVVAADWRAVCERADVDLVSIVTPPATHKEMALHALDCGKAVLCEKPMAMNAAETDAMRRHAQAQSALALIDHELRFLRGRQSARDLLRAGEIGRVRHIKFTFRSDSRADGARPWNWWSDAAAGGGALGAIGSHAVDTFHWLLGARITHVAAQLATHVGTRPDATTNEPRPVTTDDEANLLVRFADTELTAATTGTIALSMVEAGPPEHRVEIYGERGALLVAEPEAVFRAAPGSGAWQPVELLPTELAPGLRDSSWSRGFTAYAAEIVRALQAGARQLPYAATFADGHRIQLVLDAARHAHETGRTVQLEA